MGKRKRSERDDSRIVENLWKKVKKLGKKRRRISSSSSNEEPVHSPERSPHQDLASDLELRDEIPAIEETLEGSETPDENQDLDPDLLQLLGSDPSEEKLFGENLHKDIATRWKHILVNGLPKDEKLDLLKRYLPAENCAYMKAPLLNPEIKSALSETNVKKDSYSEQKQNQMSSCISAIGRSLNLTLSHSERIPQDLIKTLSDAGRLLCDTHYRESLSRRFSIVNSISKQKRELIKNTKIDEHLFGANLSEYLKSSKAISISASELRSNTRFASSNQTQRTQPSTSTPRQPGALNIRGAPRLPVAGSRVYPNQPWRPPPPPAPAPRDYRRTPTTSRSRFTNHPQQNRRR